MEGNGKNKAIEKTECEECLKREKDSYVDKKFQTKESFAAKC